MISRAIRSGIARTRVGVGPGLEGLRRAGAGQERERHAVDVGVLGVEESLVVGGVAHPSQGPADDLLAKQLGAERSDTQNVSHRVRVPSLGQHRDTHDATDVFPELAGLADGVHDFAEQVFVGQALGVPPGEPNAVLGLELLDFHRGDLLEIGAHPFARFELLAVDQDRKRSGLPSTRLRRYRTGPVDPEQEPSIHRARSVPIPRHNQRPASRRSCCYTRR